MEQSTASELLMEIYEKLTGLEFTIPGILRLPSEERKPTEEDFGSFPNINWRGFTLCLETCARKS